MEFNIQVLGKVTPRDADILTPDALAFVADLAREFEPTRRALIGARATRQEEIDAGQVPNFLSATADVRSKDWHIASTPKDLLDRRVELTGPSADRRMVINALNSGAQVYMTDFEDAHSPHWSKTLEGQINVRDAARGSIRFTTPEGREYTLGEVTATLVVRPRGLHLLERHLLVDGQPIAGSFFDFGISFFHNVHAQLERGTGPYFYLPKLQSHLEAQTCRLARLRAGAAWLLDHDRRWQDRSAGAAGDALFGRMLHLWADLDEKLRADYGFKGCVHGAGRRCDDSAPVRCLACAR